MSKNSINMLNGPLLKNILFYTIPIIFSSVLQLLFNAADLIVVGRFCGSVSVAAVGATTSLIHLLTNFFIGLSVGTGVTTAMSIGAGDKEYTKQIVHTAIPTALISGIILTVLGISLSENVLHLMSTPENVLPLSAIYMKIYFAGITATMLYNFCAAILRAAGDTKSPLVYLTVSGILNVLLNLIFVIFLDMDVAGVALATTISQILSALLTLYALIKRTDACKLNLKEIKIYKKPFINLIKIGLPAGVQSSLFSISNVIIQSSINSFGEVVVAGSAAAANIEGFVYVIMNSFHQTALNFAGQNAGIKNYKRILNIYKDCILCVVLTGLVLGSVCHLFADKLLSIYITDSSEAITQGIVRLTFICLPYFLAGIMDVTTGAIRGMGVSVTPMIITVIGVCVVRIVWIFSLFQIEQFHTPAGLYISYPISWILTFIAELITFIYIYKKRLKNN